MGSLYTIVYMKNILFLMIKYGRNYRTFVLSQVGCVAIRIKLHRTPNFCSGFLFLKPKHHRDFFLILFSY